MSQQKFKVGTFAGRSGRRILVDAYTNFYEPTWPGCIEYEIGATSADAAKRIAIRLRREHEKAEAKNA